MEGCGHRPALARSTREPPSKPTRGYSNYAAADWALAVSLDDDSRGNRVAGASVDLLYRLGEEGARWRSRAPTVTANFVGDLDARRYCSFLYARFLGLKRLTGLL